MASRFSVETIFKAVDRMSAPVSRMQNRIGKFTRSMQHSVRNLDKTMGSVHSGIKRVGVAAAAALAIVSTAGADVVNTGMQFEQTIVNAAAKFPGEIQKGTDAFKVLEDAAKATGKSTEFTASQAAEAINFLAMAGFNAEQAVSALPMVVDLATAAQMDLARASDVATDALGAFGLSSSDAVKQSQNLQRITDVLAKTANSANTSVDELFESMKKAGPIATSAGAEIETVAAMIATMANAGIKAEKAGTATANAFLNFVKPAKEAREMLASLNVDVRDAGGNLKDIPDIIDELNRSTKDLTKADRLEALAAIFGREGLAGIANVVAAGGDAMREYRNTLRTAGGETQRVAGVMRDTLQGRFNSLKSAVEGVKLSIFGLTEGPLNDAVDKMTEWVRANEQLIALKVGDFFNVIVENFAAIVSFIKKVGIGLAVFYSLFAVLKSIAFILTLVNLVMLANPITLIVIGVIAAIAAFAALITWIDNVIRWFESLPGPIRAALLPLEGLVRLIKFIKDNIGVVGDVAKAAKNFVFGDDEDRNEVDRRGRPKVVTPAERTASSIEEKRETSSAEVTIKDDTGRAEITRGRMGNALRLQKSGGF